MDTHQPRPSGSRPAQARLRHRKPQARHSFEEPPQRDLALQAGQRRAQAIVDALTERQVAVLHASEIKAVGVLELRLVAVGRRENAIDQIAPRNREAGDLDRLPCVPLRRHLDRAVEAEQLLDGACVEGRFVSEAFELPWKLQ